MGIPVPRQLYPQTRLHNVFYDTDLLQQLQGEVDLVILDGPNGNGRSIAFPLLRGVVKTPFFCFVDDITHHPYMEQMSRVFDYDIVFLEHSGRDAYVLVRVGSVK
jgi:DNA-binding transcriptional LysR family regulator